MKKLTNVTRQDVRDAMNEAANDEEAKGSVAMATLLCLIDIRESLDSLTEAVKESGCRPGIDYVSHDGNSSN